MLQVLFRIPIHTSLTPDGIPIYGFGLMLFVAFLACTWLASRRAQREGIAKEYLQDLAIWIFVGGIVGARIVFMIQYHRPIEEFYKIWEGGLVFYGSALGGVAGYALAYLFVIRKHNLSSWQLADIVAPSVALGLCLGRIGCFFNGCCFGNVATCADCPKWQFALCNPAYHHLVEHGYQTVGGFTLKDTGPDNLVVDRVAAHSPAAEAGLQRGDRIVAVKDVSRNSTAKDEDVVHSSLDLQAYLFGTRGLTDVELTVQRDGQEVKVGPIRPQTLGLHPTQLYESISMGVLFLLLIAAYPFRRRYGEIFVLFMVCYAVHRFLNEMLRDDTDPLADGLTLSQNGSILFLLAGIALWLWLRRQPAQARPTPAEPAREPAVAKA
jgi:prolipoprotein diacylglyceryltransferase